MRRYMNVTIVDGKEIEKDVIEIDSINSERKLLLKMPGFNMYTYYIGKSGEIPFHVHDGGFVNECGYIISGKGLILTYDKEMEVSKGDAFHIDGSLPHGFRNRGNEEFIFLCLVPMRYYDDKEIED